MYWSFGIVNNKLSEIYFERKGKKIKFLGYCYVKGSGYKTKKEQKWIEEDTKKVNLIFKNNEYEKRPN